jgi:acyl-[acyl-carrier-protein]-phospholipid O-acyltransferase/long-chain-fatty-acid--[acyl-carrier-protein] ligase
MKRDLSRLNFVQSLAAFNENYFRFLIAYYLMSLYGSAHTSWIMADTGAVAVIPFILFSTLGGLLADRYDKSLIIKITRIVEVFLLALTYLAFFFHSEVLALFLLFLTATTAAIFSPSKYGIIPEIFPKARLLYAMSTVSFFTYLGTILGSAMASSFLELSNFYYMIALTLSVVIGIIGFLASLKLPALPPANLHKKISFFIYQELSSSMTEMGRIPKLLPAALAYGYIFFVAGYTNLNIVPFAIEMLNLRYIDGGYLFLSAAVGIAIGSYFAAKINIENINLLYIPAAGLFLSLSIFFMGIIPPTIWTTLALLTIAGFFAGLIIVYSSTYILKTSPKETRGRNFSTANFFSFLFILLSTAFLALLNTRLKFTPAESFSIIAVINSIVMLYFFKAFKKNKLAKL